MIKVCGRFENSFIVELDYNSFLDICPDKMTLEESDKIISDAIEKKYGVYPDYVYVKDEIK
jgi:hypothetical protein